MFNNFIESTKIDSFHLLPLHYKQKHQLHSKFTHITTKILNKKSIGIQTKLLLNNPLPPPPPPPPPVIKKKKTRKRKRMSNNNSNALRKSRKRINSGLLTREDLEKRFGAPTKNSLPSVAILKNWFLNHFNYPYPNKEEKMQLKRETKLTLVQITNWCSNCRKRIWRPAIMEKEIERNQQVNDNNAIFRGNVDQLPPKKRRKLQ